MLATPELVEATHQTCLDDPTAAAIRDALLQIELTAHRSGWNSPDNRPWLFQLDMNTDTHDTDWRATATYNGLLDYECENNGGNVGNAMLRLARDAEAATRRLRDGLLPLDAPDWVPAETLAELQRLRDKAQARLAQPGIDGEDLVGAYREGYDYVGYGLRTNIWGTVANPDTPEGQKARRYAKEHRLSEYPGRREHRLVVFVVRTGETWVVERSRGHAPKVVLVDHDDVGTDSLVLAGGIFNGLGRLVNAAVAEPVPVWSATMPARPPRPSGPNPLIRPTS